MNPPIDAGTFSRLKSGLNTLDADRIAEFCGVVGNNIYPEWQAYQLGCTLVMIQSEDERRAEEAEARAVKAEEKARLLTEILSGRAAS